MRCQWQAFIDLLPAWLRSDVDRLGSLQLQELRLRVGNPPELVLRNKSVWLSKEVRCDDLHYVINMASQYSPWAASTIAQGFITANGGHRIGICGEAVMQNNTMQNIRNPTSLCIRVSRDFPDIGKSALKYTGSVLIIGKPGSGKTTLLRDLIRLRSDCLGDSITVIDERGELFPFIHGTSCYYPGRRTDVLRFCTKGQGITTALRTMGPSCIAVDEITEQADCRALLRAGWSGVSLLATAHAGSYEDLLRRAVYRPIITNHLFDTILVMQPDKSWHAERMYT